MNKRRILKTTSWRVIGTVLTGTTAYIVTGNLPLATGAALVDAVIKYVAYYYHEVLWDMKKEKEDVEEIVKDITAAKSRRPAPRPDKCCGGSCHTDTEEEGTDNADKPKKVRARKVRGTTRINDRNRR